MKNLVEIATKVISDHEMEIHLCVDGGDGDLNHYPEFKFTIQTEQMVDWIEHIGYCKLKALFAGKNIHETGEKE